MSASGQVIRNFMVPAVKQELQRAEDVLGYETYVRMAGPFRSDQTVHMTDNREEMQRARHAFELAAAGSICGDDFVWGSRGVSPWRQPWSKRCTNLKILPGTPSSLRSFPAFLQPSQQRAAAVRRSGHDFCILSLSDNLKPWDIIEKRIALAAEADLAMAFYNPISKPRPWQLPRAIEILRQYRSPDTPIVLGRDIGRPGETLRVITLAELTPEQVDMRTVIIVGSSLTRSFDRMDGGRWVYTPRWYGTKPEA